MVRSKVDDAYLAWPVQQALIERFAGPAWRLFEGGRALEFRGSVSIEIPAPLYELLIKGYTEKQWGVRCVDLDKELAARISINKSNADVLTPNRRWNALPRDGYTAMVQRMIAGIAIETRFDYLRRQHEVVARKLLILRDRLTSISATSTNG